MIPRSSLHSPRPPRFSGSSHQSRLCRAAQWVQRSPLSGHEEQGAGGTGPSACGWTWCGVPGQLTSAGSTRGLRLLSADPGGNSLARGLSGREYVRGQKAQESVVEEAGAVSGQGGLRVCLHTCGASEARFVSCTWRFNTEQTPLCPAALAVPGNVTSDVAHHLSSSSVV